MSWPVWATMRETNDPAEALPVRRVLKGTAMPASIHPPVQLNIVLDEESYAGGDSVEMARRFTAVAPTEVVRASKGSQRANVLRFDLGGDEVVAEAQSDPLWRDALVTWLDEEFDETSALVARENDARKNNGQSPVPFSWAEAKFGTEPVIAIRMKDSAIPPEAAGYVARARELLAQGAFGADPIAVIRIPACVSIEAQQADAHLERDSEGRRAEAEHEAGSNETADLREIGRLERGSSSTRDILSAVETAAGFEPANEGGQAAANPDGENAWHGSAREQEGPTRDELDEALAEAEAAMRMGSDPTDAAAEERDVAADEGEVSVRLDVVEGQPAAAANPSSEACALSGDDVPATLDYRVWNVAYTDGTSVRFDSLLGEAILD